MQYKNLSAMAFLFLCIMLISLKAQNYQISFTGTGLSETVNSVQVLNLAQGTSLTLNNSEILYLVGTINSIETGYETGNYLNMYPNPMTDKSEIKLLNSQKGQVNIEIIDITGKSVLKSDEQLDYGQHTFEVSGLNPGIYLVNVLTSNGKYAGKLLSKGENSGTPVIRYQGNDNLIIRKSTLKSTQSLVQMQYNDGERLLLKGISGNYSRVLTLLPDKSQTVNFEFIACTDADGNHYAVVTIGTQTWMAENLKYLPAVHGPYEGWETATESRYAVYGYTDEANDVAAAKTTANFNTYGVLYNWTAAMAGSASSLENPSGVQGVCPAGWHLPSDAECVQLENYLADNGYNYDGSIGGGKSKVAKSMAVTSGWTSSDNTGAVGNTDFPDYRNKSGFSALPGGYRYFNGMFNNMENMGYWWSATEVHETNSWERGMIYSGANLILDGNTKVLGFSVRCVKN